jgi:hypothetical protein
MAKFTGKPVDTPKNRRSRFYLVPIWNKQKMGSGCGAITGSNELANPGGSHLLTGRKPDFQGDRIRLVEPHRPARQHEALGQRLLPVGPARHRVHLLLPDRPRACRQRDHQKGPKPAGIAPAKPATPPPHQAQHHRKHDRRRFCSGSRAPRTSVPDRNPPAAPRMAPRPPTAGKTTRSAEKRNTTGCFSARRSTRPTPPAPDAAPRAPLRAPPPAPATAPAPETATARCPPGRPPRRHGTARGSSPTGCAVSKNWSSSAGSSSPSRWSRFPSTPTGRRSPGSSSRARHHPK